jgi:hypothetical protein
MRELLSDRLLKDIKLLMNSSFWIDALKSGYAKGIGRQLSCKYFYIYLIY